MTDPEVTWHTDEVGLIVQTITIEGIDPILVAYTPAAFEELGRQIVMGVADDATAHSTTDVPLPQDTHSVDEVTDL